MVPVGLDVGYGYTKAFGPGGEVIFPSVVGPVSGRIFTLGDAGVPRIAVEGREYVCGEAALKHSPTPIEVRSRDFVHTEAYRVLLLWALCELGEEEAAVVLGLPVGHFQSLKEELERYEGGHRVMIDGAERELAVRILRVVPQPVGTVLDFLLNRLGEAVSDSFLGKTVGVVDIGHYTTDLVVFEDLEFSAARTGGSDVGVSAFLERVREKLEERFRSSFTLREVERAVQRGRLRFEGRDHPLDLGEEIEAFASAVMAVVRNVWGDPRKLDEVILTGGGARLLGERLKREIPHAAVAPEPVFANVRGFFKYAVRLLRREKEQWAAV